MIDIFEHRLGSHVLKSKGEHPPAPGTLIIASSVKLLVFVEGASVVAKNKKKGICRIIIGGIVYSHPIMLPKNASMLSYEEISVSCFYKSIHSVIP